MKITCTQWMNRRTFGLNIEKDQVENQRKSRKKIGRLKRKIKKKLH